MPVTTSSDRRTTAAPAPVTGHRVLAALVVAIVLGILVMHTFGDTHSMATDADHAAMAAQMSDQMSDQGTDPTGASGLASPGGNGDLLGNLAPDMSMMMLCGAMLLSAGALLLLVARWRRTPRLSARYGAAGRVRELALTGIVRTRPPPAWDFSVIRC